MRAIFGSLIFFSIICYPAQLLAETVTPVCERAGVKVLTDFQGGNINGCEFSSDGRLTISVAPENEPINSSPWYAFRLLADATTDVAIVLDYGAYKHRYTPDFSIDGVKWQTYPAAQLDLNKDKSRAGFSLRIPQGKSVVIAAQPLLTSSHYARWLESLKEQHGVTVSSAGPSVEGRPLWRVTTPVKKHTLLLLGRQHPPETTGALALISFVERLFEDDALATRFRNEVGLLLYPLINPDGVDQGHWRHNVQGKDLNREWGPFSQPENRVIDSDVAQWVERHDSQLIKSIDFHSTYYEVFYTQPDQSASTMPDLLGDWLADFEVLMRSQFDDFDIRRQVSENPQVNAAKHYFFTQYGISSTTLEMGDETDRGFIAAYGRAAAESFMSAYFDQLSADTVIDNRPLDFLFKGGLVVDGTRAPPYQGNVGVRDGPLMMLSEGHNAKAGAVIDITEKVTTLGFIDIHTHARADLVSPDKALMASYPTKGVSTVIVGNDGGGATRIQKRFDTIFVHSAGTNVAQLLGYASSPRRVMGDTVRQTTASGIDEMKSILT